MNDDFYMSLAINEAWKFQFLTYPNPAVACVILDKFGSILSIAAHQRAGQAHAELSAVIKAFNKLRPDTKVPSEPNLAYDFILKNHANLFKDATAFVTLEPCNHFGKTPPCAKLLAQLGFKKVVISMSDENEIASGGAEFLRSKGIEVVCGVMQKEGRDLLKPFLKWQNGTFKLFKLALSMNGSVLGGIVSGEMSRTYAHCIRSRLDLLVIGGNTARIDRPILDTRLCESCFDGGKFCEFGDFRGVKAPNICILSRSNLADFDKTIPLFNVPNREIFTQIPQNAKFIMYEGGEAFLREFASDMDMFLIFQNSHLNLHKSLNLELSLKPLHRRKLGDDTCGIYELG